MSILQHAPRFDAADAVAFTREIYGIKGAARPLTSERDQNFFIQSAVGRFVLKIANAIESRDLLDAQNAAMSHLTRLALCPQVVPAVNGQPIVQANGHWIRLLTWIDGVPLAAARRHSMAQFEDLGRRMGEIDRELTSFDHPAIHRDFHWDLATGLAVVERYLPLIADREVRHLIEREADHIAQNDAPRFERLPRSAIHNDANDHNVLVGEGPSLFDRHQLVVGLIDFGDMVHGYTVGDLAVAVAYAVLGKPDPLAVAGRIVAGYHAVVPLSEEDISSLFPLVKLRLCMSAAVAAEQQRQRPADEYLGVSQAAIRDTLPKLLAIHPTFAEATFNTACDRTPAARTERVSTWLNQNRSRTAVVPADRAVVVDLSVGSPLVDGDPRQNAEPLLTRRIEEVLRDAQGAIGIGRYGEARLLYTAPAFAAADGNERRTVHLGVDLFAPAGTPVHAPLDGSVFAFSDNAATLDYGPVIILEHETDSVTFFTLYGHLTRESLDGLTAGRRIEAGETFAAIGSADVNGGWTPHLHFQVITDPLDLGCDFPGVCRSSEFQVWSALSPNPGPLLALPQETPVADRHETAELLHARRRHVGHNLSIGYQQPLHIVRGWMQYLFDESGRRFVDAYNNVPHVGHCHPRVTRAAADQARVLNTNTRYLYDSLSEYAARLTATFPDPLRICYFVNSGSEANELAIRLARTHTLRQDVIVLEAAYHGNSSTLIDLSPYKFDGPGGGGRQPWVHIAPVPDTFRGRYHADDEHAGRKYADDVGALITSLVKSGHRPAAYLAETCPSVGGQIMFPRGYLESVYAHVREAGGLCIADEVQTAYGRLGTCFYAFEDHGVVPDIVVLGKPIGNGYPIGAVVTTEAIAASFDNGMEFFSTFGGSTVSCAVGLTVLDVVLEEKLQSHALRVGQHLLAGLRGVASQYPTVGHVRGSGLFLGVELIKDPVTLEPAREEADYVVNRMREEGMLIGTDGPWHNVLKIRPPMPFTEADADVLISALGRMLGELYR